jgi:IS30 family transposase
MSYSHLTITERIKIEAYLELGLKPCQIANKLGVHRSTISRELRRCQNGYSAALAQEQYDHRAKQKGRKSCLTPELKKEIEDGLKSSWSPEQICGRYQLEQKPMVAFKTIYNWLYAGLIDLDLSVLRRKGKTRQPKETRGTFRIGTSIAKRPKEVRNRETFGHWELDTVVSSRGQKQGLFSDLSGAKNALLLSFQDTRQNSQIHVFSHRTTL